LWVADAGRVPCGEGVFWLAAVRDAFSRRIVGWKTSDRCDIDLVLGAVEYALWSREVRGGQLIHHSGLGSNYTSFRFTQRLADHGIAASTGSVGDSFDNALMENFWSTLTIELGYRTAWSTRDEAENAIFAYIDGWYNTRRIQKGLGWLSPDEYEAAWHARQSDESETATVTPAPTGAWQPTPRENEGSSEVAVKCQPGTTTMGKTGTAAPQGAASQRVLTKAH
jgi:transposase InsO family protein